MDQKLAEQAQVEFNEFLKKFNNKYDSQILGTIMLATVGHNFERINEHLKRVATSMPENAVPSHVLSLISDLQNFRALSDKLGNYIFSDKIQGEHNCATCANNHNCSIKQRKEKLEETYHALIN